MAFDPISAALDIGGKLIDRLWPNPEQRDAAKLELLKMQQSGELAILASETELAKGQQAINVEEAKSASLFVAGWRPFIGWVCGSAYAYVYVIQPFLVFILTAAGKPVTLPVVNFGDMATVLLGMLGLGSMRSYEKVKGVSK